MNAYYFERFSRNFCDTSTFQVNEAKKATERILIVFLTPFISDRQQTSSVDYPEDLAVKNALKSTSCRSMGALFSAVMGRHTFKTTRVPPLSDSELVLFRAFFRENCFFAEFLRHVDISSR